MTQQLLSSSKNRRRRDGRRDLSFPQRRRLQLESLEDRMMLAADLRIVSGDAPDSAIVGNGQTADFSWTVVNEGDTATDASIWFDSVYLSEDDQFDAADRWLGGRAEIPPVPLAPSDTYFGEVTFAIPSFPAGERFVLIVADSSGDLNEDDETNNVLALPINLSQPDVDLAVGNVEVPSFVIAGQPFAFSYELDNSGSETGRASRSDFIYLSDDMILSPDDPLLRDNRVESPAVFPGQGLASVEVSGLSVPADTAAGDYYLIVQLDFFDEQFETNALNQAGFIPLTVSDAAPDLTITSANVPASADPGETISVDWSVENQAAEPAVGSWSDGVYLSVDNQFDLGSDTL